MTFDEDDVMRKALREPFPPELIGKIPKAGMQLDYVGHAAVTDRLNEVEPGWTYRIDHVAEATGNDGWPHVQGILATMTIGGVSRQEAGSVDRPENYGEELKKAISDFIRRGAMRFGVAIDLWSKEDLQASAAGATSLPETSTSGGSSEPTLPGSSEEGGNATAPETRPPDQSGAEERLAAPTTSDSAPTHSGEGPEATDTDVRALGKDPASSGMEGPSPDAFTEKFGTLAAALRVANRKFGVKKLEEMTQRQAERLLLEPITEGTAIKEAVKGMQGGKT